ncbi:DUF3011 domain-containing protein [Bdellovibrio sp. HCB209]|uniref:DUF3011 domain-containing protein n=1 Tax=Bdellovibrio sp. HCB209 TaxID=3394354 RepID=UPI0039B5375B
MKKTIIALIALCALTQTAHAYDFDYSDSEEIAAFGPGRGDDRRGDDRRGDDRRDDRRDDRGGNNGPGWGRPGNGGPHNPGPRPGPNPSPRPPQPPHNPQPRIEFVTCESQGNRYNTCYVDPRGIRNFYLSKQRSSARCEQNRSFGLSGDRIWVDHGCRGVFAIERY